jgi:DNA-binding NarL/FixJ family response regulator
MPASMPGRDAPPVQYARTSDGVSIAFSTAGAGPAMVRTPGGFGNLSFSTGMMREAFAAFAARFTLTYFDWRGQGFSTRGLPATTTIDDFVRDLEAVVERTQTGPFVLYAQGNYTGAIAIAYAAGHPGRVSALVLHDYIDFRHASYAAPYRDLAEADWEAFLGTIARVGFARYTASDVSAVLREAMTQQDLLVLNACLRASAVEALLERITAPVLVLAARRGTSTMPSEDSGRWLAATLADARLVLTDGPDPVESDGTPVALGAIESFLAGLQVAPAPGPGDVLSAREVEVLRLIAQGRSNAAIASALVISLNTVRRHVSNIFDKIGAANRAEAAAYALRHGLA